MQKIKDEVQLLFKWKGFPLFEASRDSPKGILNQSPEFHLGDKVVSNERENVTIPLCTYVSNIEFY